MLTIRDEQIEAFRAAKRGRFMARAAVFLRQAFPRQTEHLGEDQLAAAVEAASEKAVAYGLRSELDHIRYLGLMISLGPDFESKPEWRWIREILDNPHLDGEGKMLAILERGAAQAQTKGGVGDTG